MYGKIFTQIYDGSLYGRWQALVTFQQLIVLADQDGTVDMMPEAIAARTSIPLEIIQQGISELEQPDKRSRTPDEEGRRIVRLSDSRDWGWTITNYAHYRAIRTAEERREYFKEHKRKMRAIKSTSVNQSPPVSTGSPLSPPIVEVEANAEVQAEVDKTVLSNSSSPSPAKPKAPSPEVRAVLDHYTKTHPKRKGGPVDQKAIEKALAIGYSPDDLCLAIDGNASDQWHIERKKHGLEYVLRPAKVADFIDLGVDSKKPLVDENGVPTERFIQVWNSIPGR